MSRRFCVVTVTCWALSSGAVFAASPSKSQPASYTGLWNLPSLYKAPAATWGEASDGLREVYYAGEPLDGKPTRVFAYYARPTSGGGPFPGMVLVHGGGGAAFANWAKLWAKRGYAAIAMDLGGCGPKRKRLPDGMPAQGHPEKFRTFTTDEEARRLWTYHAIAAVLRGHSLLLTRKEVDADRTGLTGISWGGYLTCIAAGLDDRFKVAVPVYGCGFLHENSCWLGEFARLGPEQTKRWVAYFDPSRYLPGVRCPILFMNGTNDFAYPLDSYRKSYRLVPGRADVRVAVRMPHGHAQGWAPKEIGLYVDAVLKKGDPLPKLGEMTAADGTASAAVTAKVPVVSGQLHYTTGTGPWKPRTWQSVDAKVAGQAVSAKLPAARPLVYYLSVTDKRGAMVSTAHAELPAAGDGFAPLFPTDSLKGWHISHWADVATSQQVAGQAWKVEKGVLYGLGKRTWLFSEAEYGDFALAFDVKISRGANGGVGLRFPPKGDPAYTAMELQVVDHEVYYRGRSRPEQRTASIYDEIPARSAPSPVGKWTTWQVTCKAARVTVVVDGRTVLEADLSRETKARQQKGPPLARRPLKGRIGFQNLSGLITLRNLRIKTL